MLAGAPGDKALNINPGRAAHPSSGIRSRKPARAAGIGARQQQHALVAGRLDGSAGTRTGTGRDAPWPAPSRSPANRPRHDPTCAGSTRVEVSGSGVGACRSGADCTTISLSGRSSIRPFANQGRPG